MEDPSNVNTWGDPTTEAEFADWLKVCIGFFAPIRKEPISRIGEARAFDVRLLTLLARFDHDDLIPAEPLKWIYELVKVASDCKKRIRQREPVDPDDDAYVPARLLYQPRGMTAAQCNAMLKKSPQIRRCNPTKNRLKIHSGDWHRHWAKEDEANFKKMGDIDSETFNEWRDEQETMKATIREENSRK